MEDIHYRLEVSFPDISIWSEGNTGIPYLWSFDSGKSGPHTLLQALTHGNEVCGAIALNFLLREGLRPVRGKLSYCFANYAAYQKWNPKEPFASRCIDEDFNRLWSSEVLQRQRDSSELYRARELQPFYDTVEYLLDIHSMTDYCPPLLLAGIQRKGWELARALAYPEHIIVDAGHQAGRRLRDYTFFDDPGDPRTAMLLECGQHWQASSPQVALQTSLRFLRYFGMIEKDFLDRNLQQDELTAQRTIEVTTAVTIKTEQFRFIEPVQAMQVIEPAEKVIALDGDSEVRTPYAQCVLIMPARRNKKIGDTAVRFGRYV